MPTRAAASAGCSAGHSDGARSTSTPWSRMADPGASPELRPLPFRNDLDRAVDDLDGRLFVDGIGRDAEVSGPPLRVSQGVLRESVQMREDREVDDSQGAVVRRGRPLDE